MVPDVWFSLVTLFLYALTKISSTINKPNPEFNKYYGRGIIEEFLKRDDCGSSTSDWRLGILCRPIIG